MPPNPQKKKKRPKIPGGLGPASSVTVGTYNPKTGTGHIIGGPKPHPIRQSEIVGNRPFNVYTGPYKTPSGPHAPPLSHYQSTVNPLAPAAGPTDTDVEDMQHTMTVAEMLRWLRRHGQYSSYGR